MICICKKIKDDVAMIFELRVFYRLFTYIKKRPGGKKREHNTKSFAGC